MKKLKHAAVFVALTIILCVTIRWGSLPAAAQNAGPSERWEYAYFVFKDKKMFLLQGNQELEVNPPMGGGPAFNSDGGRQIGRYTTSSRQVQNHEVGALSYFGSMGWEVVSVSAATNETRMLMKRRY